MIYKGYTGTVEFSEEDECLFGRILGINDTITYEAQSIPDLKKAFCESVDDYLEFCKKQNKTSNKPYSGKLLLRIDPELHKKISIQAREKGLSLNQYVLQVLSGINRMSTSAVI